MTALKDYWYIVGTTIELKKSGVLGATLFDDWIAIYRDSNQKLVAVEDRCLHRNARLSKGRVRDGALVCPYHGWRYEMEGRLTAIPSEGPKFRAEPPRCLKTYAVAEKDGYIFVNLGSAGAASPFAIPYLGAKGYQHIRLKHVFAANVANCAENFIDVPHTTYVHPGIFRWKHKPQCIEAEVSHEGASVHIRYLNETSNFGIFSWFLNRGAKTIFHEDHFYAPNVTHVEYRFARRMHFNITSQSVPVRPGETHVYTDLTYDYGLWNFIARPFVRGVGKKIIAQDVAIMADQNAVIEKYGHRFQSVAADLQHLWIERIHETLEKNGDLSALPSKSSRVEFYI